jgi:nitrate ABC transporter ATP-binding subunit
MSHSHLELTGVGIDFPTDKGLYRALQNVNLRIDKGEFVSLIGHSGCGKSTVLNLVAGHQMPSSGKVVQDGKLIDAPRADRARAFQNYSLLPWLTVRENVFQAVDAVFGALMPPYMKSESTEYYLRMVSLWDHRQKLPSQLSGGMRQRVSIARAFAVQPRVLLLDEPFGALDALTKGSLHEELLKMWSDETKRHPQTVMMVTHDIDEAISLSARIVVMSNGPAATISEVINVPLERPRDKRELMDNRDYLDIKARLLELLQEGFARPVLHEVSAA